MLLKSAILKDLKNDFIGLIFLQNYSFFIKVKFL
jgi:hypothetical protein